MKYMVILTVLLAIQSISYCQKLSFSKEYYEEKSRHQKNAGLVLEGTGIILIAGGALIANGGSNGLESIGRGAGAAMVMVLGAVLVVVGLPVLAASGRNKKKAATFSFKSENNDHYDGGNLAVQYYPAVSFKLRF